MMGQLDVLPVQQQWAERDKREKKDTAQVSHHDQSNQRGTTDPSSHQWNRFLEEKFTSSMLDCI